MAATFDAKAASQNFNNTTGFSFAHTVAADATALFVLIPYWSTSTTVGNITGVTWNAGAMTLIGKVTRSNGQDTVEAYFLPGPTTGAHNVAVTLSTVANVGSVYSSSFKGTPTSGGSGVVWADFTQTHTTVNGANSSLSVPNNTANGALIDAVTVGAQVTPTMGTQTNRILGASGSHAAGEGEGWSYLVPGPAGSQTMDWTFVSNSSAQAGLRVLGAVVATKAPPPYRRPYRTFIRRF